MGDFLAGCYDVIVVGAGHAGCEAALACARMGHTTLCLTMNLDSIALMACNPAIGGTSKGHLVREIDALGGEMGMAADDCFIQSKMLNTGKGPAVHSLRVQADKRRYHERMKRALEGQENVFVRQGEVNEILTQNNRVCGVITTSGARYHCAALIIASGVYLKSRILIGEFVQNSGPSGLFPANGLSRSLCELGFTLRRFKTGTPARVNRRSLDFERMQPQYGDLRVTPFSFLHDAAALSQREQVPCYLTYTNEKTHQIIRDNFHRAPLFSGKIKGTGARYCPSLEDKVYRFAEKNRHQLFLEPEGESSQEYYVQGCSSSLPEDVQIVFLRSIVGMEHVEIMRFAYAIEYDCIDSTQLKLSLESKTVKGLFFAGQVNGSSGYEEAAAQGLMAGINTALYLQKKQPFVLDRSQAYIGVLIDDLVTKGTNEPYRMMTSRAEYRLILRQDNADLRLTELGYRVGLASKERFVVMENKRDMINSEMVRLERTKPVYSAMLTLLEEKGQPVPLQGAKLLELIKRPHIGYADIACCDPEHKVLTEEECQQIEIQARYAGYIQKQQEEVDRFKNLEGKNIPSGIDYASIDALRIEARQKLEMRQPANLGQASRISGVSPADISVLLVYLEKLKKERQN